jgi:MFS family permease
LLWIGGVLSHTGDDMQLVAVSWLVMLLTGSPFLMGVANVFQGLPRLFFGILGGVLADRKNRHKLLILYQAIEMFFAFLFSILVFTGQIQFWHVLVLLPIFGFLKSVYQICRQAYMFDLVGKEELMNALALHSTGMNLAKIIGPSIGGIIIGIWGVGWCLLLNGLSFIAIFICFLMMRPPATSEKKAHVPNLFQSLGETFVYLKHHGSILFLIVASFAYMAFGMHVQVILPIFARYVLDVGASGYGFLMGAMGGGAVVGGIIVASLGDMKAKGFFFLLSSLIYAFLLILFSCSSWFTLSLFLIFLVGMVDLFSKTTNMTLVQLLSPDELRGRILGVFMLDRGLKPLGGFMMGAGASLLGAPLALALGAGVCMTFTLTLLFKAPQVRKL